MDNIKLLQIIQYTNIWWSSVGAKWFFMPHKYNNNNNNKLNIHIYYILVGWNIK